MGEAINAGIHISAGIRTPIDQQIIIQISNAIARGVLKPGDKLPVAHQLAAELVVNPNTVLLAYAQLEELSLTTRQEDSELLVSDLDQRKQESVCLEIMIDRIDTLIIHAVNLGMSLSEVCVLFNNRINRMNQSNEKHHE